nr:MAG TPA: hypothetical protein [Caudoviricetes sp.]
MRVRAGVLLFPRCLMWGDEAVFSPPTRLCGVGWKLSSSSSSSGTGGVCWPPYAETASRGPGSRRGARARRL